MFDPLTADPAEPEFERLRREEPVTRTASGAWYLARDDDVLASTKDVERFIANFREPGVVVADDEQLVNEIPEPRHGAIRRIINSAIALRDCTIATDMGGRRLCPADKVVFGISSANRDEMHFDDPYRFRLDREDPRRHLAFGGGPHVCPGAGLARLEARVALEAFLDRVAAVRPLEPDRYEGVPVLWAHGPRSLLAELDAA